MATLIAGTIKADGIKERRMAGKAKAINKANADHKVSQTSGQPVSRRLDRVPAVRRPTSS
jgi:hypothetical protein